MTEFQRTPCPTHSPWGGIEHKTELAPGIWWVSTPSHGGAKLSEERNAAMPDCLRRESGWYEEDCQWALAALVFPEAFQILDTFNKVPTREAAPAIVRDWFPTAWEAHTGETLTAADSYILAARERGETWVNR